MKRMNSAFLLAITLFTAALVGGDEAPAANDQSAPVAAEAQRVEAAPPAGAAGMTVYKDPITGRLLPIPPGELQDLLTDEMKSAVSMSQEGLAETAAPGGGVMIDLQGRFQSAMQAAVDADGKVTGHCDQGVPAAASVNPSEPRKE